MAFELRPTWCPTDGEVDRLFQFGSWMTGMGTEALLNDGDDWRPGQSLFISRDVELRQDLLSVRRDLGLAAGQAIGVAARWSCRATGSAGVHDGGPEPLALADHVRLEMSIPARIAGSIEIETCLVTSWSTSERPDGASPAGALLWSDGWAVASRDRTILLEGDEARIPVRTVAFSEWFDQPSGALWAIDLDTSLELEDRLTNVASVLINRDVLERDFLGPDQMPDASRVHAVAQAGMSVDLIRCLTARLIDDLPESDNWQDYEDGSVGAMLNARLLASFGSVDAAVDCFRDNQETFARNLWDSFAPNSWRVGK